MSVFCVKILKILRAVGAVPPFVYQNLDAIFRFLQNEQGVLQAKNATH